MYLYKNWLSLPKSVERHLSWIHNHSNRATYITSHANILFFWKEFVVNFYFRKGFQSFISSFIALIPPMAEPPNLMPPRSACLPLDTKHSKENTKLHGPVGHTTGENPKIHIFAIRITNQRIKLTSFLIISYITLHVHQSIIFIITAECNQSYEQFNWTAEYKHVNRVTTEINIY